MSKNSMKNVLENLFLLFGSGKTQNRAKTHRPSMSAFSAIFVLKENGTQSQSQISGNGGDHVNSVPDLAASPPCPLSFPVCSSRRDSTRFYGRLLGFWLRNTSLFKVGNPISDGIVFVFHRLAWCVRGLKSLKRFWPYLIAFRSCISNGKPE